MADKSKKSGTKIEIFTAKMVQPVFGQMAEKSGGCMVGKPQKVKRKSSYISCIKIELSDTLEFCLASH